MRQTDGRTDRNNVAPLAPLETSWLELNSRESQLDPIESANSIPLLAYSQMCLVANKTLILKLAAQYVVVVVVVVVFVV